MAELRAEKDHKDASKAKRTVDVARRKITREEANNVTISGTERIRLGYEGFRRICSKERMPKVPAFTYVAAEAFSNNGHLSEVMAEGKKRPVQTTLAGHRWDVLSGQKSMLGTLEFEEQTRRDMSMLAEYEIPKCTLGEIPAGQKPAVKLATALQQHTNTKAGLTEANARFMRRRSQQPAPIRWDEQPKPRGANPLGRLLCPLRRKTKTKTAPRNLPNLPASPEQWRCERARALHEEHVENMKAFARIDNKKGLENRLMDSQQQGSWETDYAHFQQYLAGRRAAVG